MSDEPEQVAIIGISGRFPGASTPEAFMENLCRGVHAVTPESQWRLPDAAPAKQRPPFAGRAAGALEDVDRFDAAYFGFTPREAEVADPQQRLFLECCAEALQRAGCDDGKGARVGVYAGMGINTYFLERVWPNARVMEGASAFQALSSNEKDFIATQVSYRLNLTGPSMTVQTACSTSLVAVVLACESLLSHQCDVALAGGSTVKVDPGYGSFLEEGGIAAPDGHCRAFDARASGTVSGSGVGVVALKRLSDALRDGDHIHAVIKGSALNNDGARKVGYAAPSPDGQASVIAEAHAVAGVDAASIGYIETHGTGTQMGDPIEVSALTRVFRQSTLRKGFCAIGSVKTNIGHADAAAGVIGLIKATLVVEQARIPPTLHFETPNPALKLDESPFYVNTKTLAWDAPLRRAGVSSFGIGGTNAHVILEQAPARAASVADTRAQLLVLSARTPDALEASAARLREHLESDKTTPLADIAATLQTGRRRFPHRIAIACMDRESALAVLTGSQRGALKRASEATDTRVAFLFPGQGAQHVGMGRGLYEREPVYRAEVDRCCELLRAELGFDLRDVLYPTAAKQDEAEATLATTLGTQPALFVTEYALAKLWMSWGVRPTALLGHSLGEYVAACIADVLPLEDALKLVALRAKLLQEMPEGAMLAVPLDEAPLRAMLPDSLSIAGINAPQSCVVSGPVADIDAFAARLDADGIESRRLNVQRAFHSAMMDEALDRFRIEVAKLRLAPPRIPILSNLTGKPLEAHEATDAAYWTRHLRESVRFSDGVKRLIEDETVALVEVGPGRILTSLAARHLERPDARTLVASMRRAEDDEARDDVMLREAIGRLWLAGARIDWRAVHAPMRPRKAILPTYPFERKRHWLEAPRQTAVSEPASDAPTLASWRRIHAAPAQRAAPRRLLLLDEAGSADGAALARALRAEGHRVIEARAGTAFAQVTPEVFTLRLDQPADLDVLLNRLTSEGRRPSRLVHVAAGATGNLRWLVEALRRLQMAPAGADDTRALHATIVTRGAFDVTGAEALAPLQAAFAAGALSLARLADGPQARVFDVDAFDGATLARLVLEDAPPVVALRGRHRWVPVREPVDSPQAMREMPPLVHVQPAPPQAEPALAKLDIAKLDALLAQEADALEALRERAKDARVIVASPDPNATGPVGAALVALARAVVEREARAGNAWAQVCSGAWQTLDEAALAVALAAPPGAQVFMPAASERETPLEEEATHARPSLGVAYVAPTGPLEEALVAIWEDLLGFRGIGVEDDFFELGGHSLLASRIVSRVRDTFDVEVALPRFFEARTIRDFSAVLEAALIEKVEAMSEDEAQQALDGQ